MKNGALVLALIMVTALWGCGSGAPAPTKVDFSGEQPSAPLVEPNIPLSKSTSQPKSIPRAMGGLAVGTKAIQSKR